MALPFPDIPPAIFTIPAVHLGGMGLGPLSVRWYAVAYIAGILLGWRYAVGLARNAKLWGPRGAPLTVPQIDDMILCGSPSASSPAGGSAISCSTCCRWRAGEPRWPPTPWRSSSSGRGGMSFHGGAIGVTLALLIFARLRRLDIIALADLVAACQPIGQGFGRIANFINGELWGRVTTSPVGMVVLREAHRDQRGRELCRRSAAALSQPAVRGDARGSGPVPGHPPRPPTASAGSSGRAR